MPRPRVEFPTPGKRLRGDRWQVFWRAGSRVYGLSIGPVSEADAEGARLEVALALRTGRWPEWAAGAAAVQRYLAEHGAADAGDLLGPYEASLRAEVSGGWANTAMGHLRELQEFAGGDLAAVTARQAQAFLDHVRRTPGPFLVGRGPRSVGTRNRALAAGARFFKWAVRTGRLHANPFQGIKTVRESDVGEIVHLTAPERDAVLAAADREPDGLAVWLALYAGLRRSELARCTWADVSLDRGRLTVPKAKTGRRRAVPLASALAERLSAVPESRRAGRIVPWPTDFGQWSWRAERLLRRLQAACPNLPGGALRWNVFRHTFGSLLAQAGVSLDKVSAWMGNSPAVCRRHYAAFVPRGRRDEDIDRM